MDTLHSTVSSKLLPSHPVQTLKLLEDPALGLTLTAIEAAMTGHVPVQLAIGVDGPII